jgi:hypothetical protein
MVTGYVAFLHGFGVRRYFILPSELEKTNALTMLWGLGTLFCCASPILFFTGARFLIFIFIVTAGIIHFWHRKVIAGYIRNLYRDLSGSRMLILFFLLLLALLIQSSQSSKINDDGLYYTQTVMWLDQAGFVKGISNLFLPLGLTSSWHVLQALFSFSFIEGVRFNDMNGFLVVVFFCYFVENYGRVPFDSEHAKKRAGPRAPSSSLKGEPPALTPSSNVLTLSIKKSLVRWPPLGEGVRGGEKRVEPNALTPFGPDIFSTVAFSLGLLISIPFLSACSPDLPVILLTIIGFDLLYRRASGENKYDLLLLAAFGFSVKLSAVALFLLPVAGLFTSPPAPLRGGVEGRVTSPPTPLRGGEGGSVSTPASRRTAIWMVSFFVLIVAIVIVKNTYQTGYPFYPFSWFAFSDLSWTTPGELVEYYQKGLQAWAFANIGTYEQLKTIAYVNFDEIIPLLVQREGYKGFINIIVFVSAGISLLFIPIHYFREKLRATLRPFLALHLVSILSFMVWLKFAPQYRFIVPVVIFNISYSVYVASSYITPAPFFTTLLPVATVIAMVILSFLTIAVTISSTSRQMGKSDGFHYSRVIFPHVSFSFAGVDTVRIAGQEYYHFKNNAYCWDCPLPCLPRTYADFLLENGYMLSKRKNEITSGFILKR